MKIKIWCNSTESVPAVYLHSFTGNGEDVWKACMELQMHPFNLVVIYDADFDSLLTPWPAEGIRKGQPPFGGKADMHLKEIIDTVIPQAEAHFPAPPAYSAMAGYSLAGLFTLWSAWHTDRFKRLACVSGSLWYPGFVAYINSNPMPSHPECIYFSLGDKESKTRHPLMSTVDACTREAVGTISSLGIRTTFESNPGNHFTSPALRTAKAIRWMLADQ